MRRPTERTKTAKPKVVVKTRIVFDVETEQFTQDFRRATDIKTRLASVPKMRLACVFDGVQWRYFLPSEAAKLCALLGKADELVTFNGNGSDIRLDRNVENHGDGACRGAGVPLSSNKKGAVHLLSRPGCGCRSKALAQGEPLLNRTPTTATLRAEGRKPIASLFRSGQCRCALNAFDQRRLQ